MIKSDKIATGLEESYITVLPTIMPYFLAAVKNS